MCCPYGPVWDGLRHNPIVKNASASVRPLPKIINTNNKSVLIHLSLKVWAMSEHAKGAHSQGRPSNGAARVIGSVSCRACDVPSCDIPLCRCPVQKQITTSCKKRHMMGSAVVQVLCLFEKVLYSRTTQRRNENCVVDAKQSFVSVTHGPITTAKIAIYV